MTEEGNGTQPTATATTTTIILAGTDYELRLLGVGYLYGIFESMVLQRTQDEARGLAGAGASALDVATIYKQLRPSSLELAGSVWEEMATLPGAVRILREAAPEDQREQLDRDALADPVLAINAAQYIAGATDEHPMVEQKKSSSNTTRKRTRKPSSK